LRNKQLELGLRDEHAHQIETEVAPYNVLEYIHAVEAVLFGDEVITSQERLFLTKKAEELSIDPWVAQQVEDALTRDAEPL